METRERAIAVRNAALATALIFLLAAIFTASPATVGMAILAGLVAVIAQLR